MSVTPLGGGGDLTSAAEVAGGPGVVAATPGGAVAGAPVGRSPGQLAWQRLRRDHTSRWSGATLLFFFVVALAAPLIEKIYGQSPTAQHPELLDGIGYPIGFAGGVSADHWLGVEPGLGRDLLMQLVYGLRTSLLIAFAAATLTIAIGVVLGILAGYAGGVVDAVLNWFTDFVLAFPFLIFCLAAIPVITNRFFGTNPDIPASFRIWLLVVVLAAFGWPYTARLVRGQVLSLREREFVAAALAAGARTPHILFRQLLPNLWAPILVVYSLAVPAYITTEAALSFLNIGVIEPTPDLGRMIFRSIGYLRNDPNYTLYPGLAIFLLVLAFNLFGDALRDALDPKSTR